MWKFLINYLLNHGLILFISFFLLLYRVFKSYQRLMFLQPRRGPFESVVDRIRLTQFCTANETFLLEPFGVHFWSTLLEYTFRSTLLEHTFLKVLNYQVNPHPLLTRRLADSKLLPYQGKKSNQTQMLPLPLLIRSYLSI